MNPSNVYFTDFHTIAFGDSLPTKLKKLIKKAGIENLDLDGKFVAILTKLYHFFSRTSIGLHTN